MKFPVRLLFFLLNVLALTGLAAGCGPKAAPPATQQQVDAQFQAQLQKVQDDPNMSADEKKHRTDVLRQQQAEAEKQNASGNK